MVTVRRYLNLAEAALAKSLLDDYEIPCALWDENAFLYGKAPFAMPIRLLVEDDRVEQAIQILLGDVEALGAIEATPDRALATEGEDLVDRSARTHPWELLAIAVPFFVPALCWFQLRYPGERDTSARRYLLAKVNVAHFFAVICLIFAATLIVAYFRVRAESIRSQTGPAGAPEN